MVSGASRLVSGVMQLTLLAFSIIAGIEAVGIPRAVVLADSGEGLGAWTPWLGVPVFAVGVAIRELSAPPLLPRPAGGPVRGVDRAGHRQRPLRALRQRLHRRPGDDTRGTTWVSRLPDAMPPHASFLPGFWLLVPGLLGLIGLAQVAGDVGSAGLQDLANTVVSIFAVAVGVLCGTLLLRRSARPARPSAPSPMALRRGALALLPASPLTPRTVHVGRRVGETRSVATESVDPTGIEHLAS